MSPPSAAPKLRSLCVFCGSQAGFDPVYVTAATTLGLALAAHGTDLVFGGGRVGLMGALADAVLTGGGKIIGVIPGFLKDKELAHPGATEMLVVPDMHSRKKLMFERSDAFCILPGGMGTLDEMFEIVTWRQLRLHDKPIILVNVANYWADMITLLDGMVRTGFAYSGRHALITVVDQVEAVIGAAEAELKAPKAPDLFKV